MKDLSFHPLSEIFPMMTAEEFRGLVEDMRQHGQRDPIVTFEGKVLDGRNRYRAAREMGVEPKTVEFKASCSPEDFVVSHNLHRRHLSESQKMMVGAQLATRTREEHLIPGNRGGSRSTNRWNEKPTTDDIAKMLKVGTSSIERAKRVLREGQKEDVQAIERGEVSVYAVHEKLLTKAGGNSRVKLSTGSRVKAPAGMTLEDLCRKGLVMEKTGCTAEDVGKEFAISPSTYRNMRAIILLTDREDLSAKDKAVVSSALVEMNETRRVAASYERVKSIAQKIWGNRPVKGLEHAEAMRLEQFEHSLVVVREGCRCIGEMEIPHLSKERADEVVVELLGMEKSLRKLKSRVERGLK